MSEHDRERPSPPESSAIGASSFRILTRWFIFGCASIGAGIALAASGVRSVGGVLVLVGWAFAMTTLHRLGRCGPG